MKLKGVNPIEQHVEKIVLVSVSGVFLLVVAAQFLYEPNRIKVGNGQTVPPGAAFHAAEEQAKQIAARMAATQIPDMPEAPSLDLVEQFRTRHSAPVAPPNLAVALGPAVKFQGDESAGAAAKGQVTIATAAVPAPANVVAAAFRSTIDPMESVITPELKPLLPTEQPMDKAAVSVAARFDGTALRTALAADPDGAGPTVAIPGSWLRDGVEVLAVRLERQEQLPSGGWSDPVEVAPPPGRFDGASQVKTVRATADMNDVLNEARVRTTEILRPAYYNTIAGPAWTPPTEMAATEVVRNPEVDRVVRQHRDLTNRIEGLQREIAKLEQAQPNPGRGAGGGGGGGKGGAGAGGGGNQAQTRDPNAANAAKRKQLDDSLARVQQDLAKVEEKLKELKVDATGKPLVGEPAAAPAGAAAKPLLDDPEIELWAHDLTVEPGKTYRYRVKVAINNPAFGRSASLVPEQQELAKMPLAFGQPSEWSTPVSVLKDQYYFIVSAAEVDEFGPARASAEVYKFFYGHYRKGSVTLEPGDKIAVNSLKLPEGSLLPIFDLEAAKAEPGEAPAQAPIPEQGGRGAQPGPAGGKGGGAMPGPAAAPRSQQAEPAEVKVVLAENAKPWTSPLNVLIDAYLLDVARSPGAGEAAAATKSQAYLRDEHGNIVVRTPEDERAAEVYRVVGASAKEGENQGKPRELADPAKPPVVPLNQPPAQPAPGKGGGAGGAGGG